MSETHVDYFKITQRITDPCKQFELTFPNSTVVTPFSTGTAIQFGLPDIQYPDDLNLFKGTIQNVEYDESVEERISRLTGRDAGLYFTRQRFNWDSDIINPAHYPASTIMSRILENTTVTIARGQTRLNDTVQFSTKVGDGAWFAGEFSTKQDALDEFFIRYAEAYGLYPIRWYLDVTGGLRWFETKKPRGSKLYFFNNDQRVISRNISENSEAVINSQCVVGGQNSELVSNMHHNPSIQKYGLLEGDVITDTTLLSQSEVDAKCQTSLEQTAYPIYSGTLVLSRVPHIACGQQLMFPDHPNPNYQNVTFTVVDITMEGKPANYTTTINFSTDENVISLSNTFDVIKAVAVAVSKDDTSATVLGYDPATGLVVLKPDDNQDAVITSNYL